MITPKKQHYKDLTFDSKLEFDFYIKCLCVGIELKREPETIELIPKTEITDLITNKTRVIRESYYIPDFKYKDLFIEVKGYAFYDDWLRKEKLIYSKHPDAKIVLVVSHSQFDDVINFLLKYDK